MSDCCKHCRQVIEELEAELRRREEEIEGLDKTVARIITQNIDLTSRAEAAEKERDEWRGIAINAQAKANVLSEELKAAHTTEGSAVKCSIAAYEKLAAAEERVGEYREAVLEQLAKLEGRRSLSRADE